MGSWVFHKGRGARWGEGDKELLVEAETKNTASRTVTPGVGPPHAERHHPSGTLQPRDNLPSPSSPYVSKETEAERLDQRLQGQTSCGGWCHWSPFLRPVTLISCLKMKHLSCLRRILGTFFHLLKPRAVDPRQNRAGAECGLFSWPLSCPLSDTGLVLVPRVRVPPRLATQHSCPE